MVQISAPRDTVWQCYTDPQHIMQWNHASDDWHSPRSVQDLRVGGRFSTRMEARDGSEGFDFEGTYTDVALNERIAYTMDDGRAVTTTFTDNGGITEVTTAFDPESANPRDMQRAGWQAILDNFKKYVEKS